MEKTRPFVKLHILNFFFVFSDAESVCTDCIGVSPPWLLYLCIAFGILFLVMLIINVFLCSAMTCSCARTDTMEKEPSIIEEFDPYTRSWQGSQYGSRWEENLINSLFKTGFWFSIPIFTFDKYCKISEFYRKLKKKLNKFQRIKKWLEFWSEYWQIRRSFLVSFFQICLSLQSVIKQSRSCQPTPNQT